MIAKAVNSPLNVTLLISFILMIGCASDGQPPATLTIGVRYPVPYLDPIAPSNYSAIEILMAVFEAPFEWDTDSANAFPVLVDNFQTDSSGLLWTFRLKPDVLLHTDDTLTAEDIKISLMRLFDPEAIHARPGIVRSFWSGFIEEIIVEDHRTLKIKTRTTKPNLMVELSLANRTPIVGKRTLGNFPSATGPFRIFSHPSPDRLVLARFPGYHGISAGTDTLTFIHVDNPRIKARLLLEGKLDLIDQIDPLDYRQLKDNPDIVVFEKIEKSSVFLGFNLNSTTFRHRKNRIFVRDVIYLNDIVTNVRRSLVKPNYSPLPIGLWGYFENLNSRDLPGSSGPDSLEPRFENVTLTLAYIGEKTRNYEFVSFLTAALSRYGISVAVISFDNFENFRNAILNDEADMFIYGFVQTLQSPYALRRGFLSGSNLFGYGNKAVDDLVLKVADTSIDEETRLQLAYQAQRLILEDCPAVFLYTPLVVWAASQHVKGFEMPEFGYVDFSKLHINQPHD